MPAGAQDDAVELQAQPWRSERLLSLEAERIRESRGGPREYSRQAAVNVAAARYAFAACAAAGAAVRSWSAQ